MHVVVLSCGSLGVDVAGRLAGLERVSRVTLVMAPWRSRRKPRSITDKVRHVYRTQGLPGLMGVVASRIRPRHQAHTQPDGAPLPASVHRINVADFHDVEAIAAIRGLAPDLGVIAGTYILKESVFGIPRFGSINLHSGKVPEYRGAAPAFWELYNGEREVGITIHRVEAAVDAGAVLAQETFPLDPAPAGDPMEYIERYRREVLRPHGVRLLVDVVSSIATGTLIERPQDTTRARTYRTPEYRDIRELRRRVRARRRERQEGNDAA